MRTLLQKTRPERYSISSEPSDSDVAASEGEESSHAWTSDSDIESDDVFEPDVVEETFVTEEKIGWMKWLRKGAGRLVGTYAQHRRLSLR